MYFINNRHRRSALYYVESIERTNEGPVAALQYIPLDIRKWEDENKDFKWYLLRSIRHSDIDRVHEGDYVYLSDNGDFQSGPDDARVRKIVDRSRELYASSERLYTRQAEYPDISGISFLYSYHINVGHGNCSLLVFESHGRKHLWMIDGSDYDFLSHRTHTSEISHCLDHIIRKFSFPEQPHIDVLMVTHAHYDHYSAIAGLIDHGFIDSRTLVYLNLHKRVTAHNFNNLLSKLNTLGTTIIPPFVQSRSSNIDILYPDLHTYSATLDLNNSSSVYRIAFDGVTYFVFPGDLETKGWNLMDTNRCKPYLTQPRYYAISHHGSLNGHLRSDRCPHRHSHCIATCLSDTTKTVLMGRDNAFRGIYSPQVMADFSGRIYCSEHDLNMNKVEFLEIDLISGTATWH